MITGFILFAIIMAVAAYAVYLLVRSGARGRDEYDNLNDFQ